MGFTESVRTVLIHKCATFSGRACRSEYWWWILFVVINEIIIDVVEIIYKTSPSILSMVVLLLATAVALVSVIPGLAVTVRRLHDLDRSGWWCLIGLLPIVGWYPLIILYCTKGTAGSNRFGDDPLAT